MREAPFPGASSVSDPSPHIRLIVMFPH